MSYRMQSPPGARVLINDRWRDYFAGCSYLGLQGHPALITAAIAALQTYGVGTATSRGGYGEHPLFDAVERAASPRHRRSTLPPATSGTASCCRRCAIATT